jgi:NADP-dependent aldehyde dehydrogenase
MTGNEGQTQAGRDTSAAELEAVLDGVRRSHAVIASMPRAARAGLLTDIADRIDAHAHELRDLAHAETNLSHERLEGEIARTTGQLRMFAEVIQQGDYLEVILDSRAGPDLRRMLVPLGPVLVFAGGNFPFAFSVAGGDAAAAIAAGCGVIVKAHPGHPRTSDRTGELVKESYRVAGVPDEAFGLIHGLAAGATALRDPAVCAASFTGSTSGGRALFDIANARPTPIPFYGELGGVNPVVVTPNAVHERADEIVGGFVGSFTLGVGQFCTNPGLLFLPLGHGLEEALQAAVSQVSTAKMLDSNIAARYQRRLADIVATPGVTRLDHAAHVVDESIPPSLFKVSVGDYLSAGHALSDECFGPAAIVVEYEDPTDLLVSLGEIEGCLTATIQGTSQDLGNLSELLALMSSRAGRVLWNSWPTGVAVSPAMHHGGPYPATTSALHTAVGATSIRRFLKPIAFQGIPQELLPAELRDEHPEGLRRQVNGTVTA